MRRSRQRRLGLGLAGALCLVTGGRADDSLLVIREGDALVFTNTPSRADARPVPGFGSVTTKPSRPRLPTTIYDPFIERAARENGLSPQLVKAVVVVESALDPHAVSPKGAQGLMQLMPATAARYGVEDPFDPLQNIRGGTRHLRDLMEEFDGNERLVLAAYNAGSAAVRRAGGVPDYPETVEYIRRIEQRLGRRPAPRDAGAEANGAPPPSSRIRARRLADGTILLTN